MTLLHQLLLLTITTVTPLAFAADWQPLPPLPDKNGFAGPFVGVSHNTLLVAGGANFPNKKPWEGGTKIYYDTIYTLDRPDGSATWKIAGHLPRPLAYGLSITYQDAVICIGGTDANQHYPDAFRLNFKAGKLTTTPLPPLPKPLANSCGALLDNSLYIAAGQEKPDGTQVSNSIFTLDLSADKPTWREIDPLPGPARILPTAAAFDHAFYIIGGAELSMEKDGKAQRHYLNDAYRFDPGKGWHRIADLPHPAVAAPSPAPFDDSGFYILGGDDGSHLGSPPDEHRGFRRTILHYDAKADKWLDAGQLPANPPVTTSTTQWHNKWIIPTGEIRPGLRSPNVWSWTPTVARATSP